jgi:diadenosine tetraphosphate (Ap4A) HIT family hydrolase
VEHAYPVGQKGWLVIVLKRHAEALHELTPAEFEELGAIQSRACVLLHETLHCQKEYISCYAETEHFHHVHFHVFGKPSDLPAEQWGGGSFALLKVSPQQAVPPGDVADFCHQLSELW